MKAISVKDARSETVVVPDSDAAVVHHITIHDSLPEGQAFQHATRLEYEGVTRDQLIELASKHVVIKARVKYNFKSADPSLIPEVIDVAELLKSEKPKTKTIDRAAKVLAKKFGVSIETLEAAIAKLK